MLSFLTSARERPSVEASPGGSLPSFGKECRETFALALPLVAGQLGQVLMGLVDTVMVGRLGVTALGASTFANALLSVPFVLGLGLLASVSVRVSQARGADDHAAAEEALRHGTWLAFAFGLGVVALALLTIPFLTIFGQPPGVTALVPNFFLLVAFSMVPAMLSVVWKNYADALDHPWPPFVILLAGVVLNIFLNWLWIYGNAGFPALGLDGAGWATLVSRVAVAGATLWWLLSSAKTRAWQPTRWWVSCRWVAFKRLLRIGIPVCFQLLTEVTAFSMASILIGTLGLVPLAAHQVAITCSTTAFMVPLGLSMALTVRVGNVIGSNQRGRLHRVLLGGWLYTLGFASISMTLFLFAGRTIASQFVSDGEVREIAVGLLIVAGLFQLFDGLQVVSAGALRGVNDVRIPALWALFAYWGIALPAGAAITFALNCGAAGMWIGLALGLALAAVALSWRAWKYLQEKS